MDVNTIKKLRDMTGAGVNAIREAMEHSKGNEEEALKYLRQKGMAKSEKRKERSADNGILGYYIHSNSKVIVVVEVNCETDFAAKSPDMVELANNIALHIAAKNPKYITKENVDPVALEAEKDTYAKDLEGKPEEVKEKILEGKLQRFYEDTVLYSQKLFTDENKTVEDYIAEAVSKIGEKIEVKNFYKFEVAQPTVMSVRN